MESQFKALFRSITVLFIDDDPEQLQFYKDSLNEHPLYNILTAGTAEEAQRKLTSGTQVHLCVLDMGINDIQNDEFYLIKKFKDRFPFIVVSGSMDMEKAYKATTFGAAGMISKPVDVTSSKLWSTLSDVFCNRAIIPALPENANPQLKLCCEMLRNNKPESVTEWAAYVNISDSYLRKLWGDCFTISPKLMLLKYKVYQRAFIYHNALYLAEINGDMPPLFQKEELAEYRHLMKAFVAENPA